MDSSNLNREEQNAEVEPDKDQTLSSFSRHALVFLGLAALATLAFLLFSKTILVLLLIFAALLLALFLRAPTNLLAKRLPIPDKIALLIVVTVFTLICATVITLLSPKVSQQTQQIGETLPSSIDALRNSVQNTAWGSWILNQMPNLKAVTQGWTDTWSAVTGMLSKTLGVVGNLLLVIFVGVYFAWEPEIYKDGLIRLVPLGRRKRAIQVMDTLAHELTWWLVGRITSMVIVGGLTSLGLWLLGVPLALTLGVIAGVLSFIPNLGPILSFVPAALVALLQGPMWVVYVGAVYLGVQFLESYLITPQIQKRTVDVPPALLLLFQVFLGILTGILGLILATPILVCLIVLAKLLYVEDILGDRTNLGTHVEPIADKDVPGYTALRPTTAT